MDNNEIIEYEIHSGIGQKSPYMEAMKEYYKVYGINIHFISELPLREPRKNERIIHMHRLGRLYNSDDMLSAKELVKKIDKLKTMGWILIWTVHNIFPIDSAVSDVDLYVTREVGKRVNLVFCHTEIMKKNLKMFFDISAINHGFAVDFHIDNNKKSFTDIYEKKGYTYGFIGNLREYKGIRNLVSAYSRIVNEGENVNAIIAGNQYSDYLERNSGLLESMKQLNITLINHYIDKNDWKVILDKIDVLVFPYLVHYPTFKFGFYASSIAQAVYQKKLIICPDDSNIECILGTLDNSIKYNPYNNDGLYEAMKKAIYLDKKEVTMKERAAYKNIENCTWSNLVKKIMTEYKKIL